jgi:PTS system cellobiose-specific IIB component
MKILLVCAGGASTGLLLKKMEKYWAEQGEPLQIKATSVFSCVSKAKDYDIIMMGPQVAYQLKNIQKEVPNPVEVIPSLDYGMQNCANIWKLAQKMYEKTGEDIKG